MEQSKEKKIAMRNALDWVVQKAQKGVPVEERDTVKFGNKLKDIIKEKFPQADDFKDYTLIENYGFTFKIDGEQYDCRFWANSYGCYIGYWMF